MKIDTTSAFLYSGAAVLFGFGIALVLRKKLFGVAKTKGQSALDFIGWMSMGYGLMGIFNELVSFPMQGLRTDLQKFWIYVFMNVLIIPAICWAILRYMKRVSAGVLFGDATQTPSVVGDSLDEKMYESAMNELNGEGRRAGAWAKALAESNGDESKAKAWYIRYRVNQMYDEPEYMPVPAEVRAELRSPITAIQYATQRGLTEKEIGQLIKKGELRSMLYGGVLYVQSWPPSDH